MFSKSVYSCLEALVGYQQPYSDCPPALSDFLTTSESGLYFQDFSPMARVDYLQEIAPNFANAVTTAYFALPVWDNVTSYPINAQVRNGLGAWKAVTPNTNEEPSFNSVFWQFQRFEPSLNGYLAETRRKAVKLILQKVFEDKTARGLTKTLLQEQFMIEGIGSPLATEPNLGRFVGVEISLGQYEGIKIQIGQIGLQLTQAQTLNLYLYHRSQSAPLRIIQVDITAAQRYAWNVLAEPITIYAKELNLAPGESYLLGYYESDLVGAAVNRSVGSANHCIFYKPCLTCGTRYEYLFWEKYNQYVSFRPISVASNFLDPSRDLPDLGNSNENLMRTWNKNYGLNFSLGVFCELDTFLCRNRAMFARLLGLQTVALLMNEAELNMRVNRTQSQTFNYIARERESESNTVFTDLAAAYKAVSFDFSAFGSPCLPCENRPGVITKVI